MSARSPRASTGLATAALVCGIVGLFVFFLLVVSVVALVLGLVAASRAKQAPAPGSGLGRARAGWILGAFGIAGFVAMIVGIAATGGFEFDEVSVLDLDVGDCVDLPDDTGLFDEISELTARECDEPHDAEVFLVDELAIDSDEYPGVETVTTEVDAMCSGPAFEDYVGTAHADSELDTFLLYPTEQTWDDDRGFVCMAITVDGSQLQDSVEGSGR